MRGPFDPPAGRQSSVVLLTRQEPLAYRLVTSISTRSTTEVLSVASSTGELCLARNFADEGQALGALVAEGFEIAARGSALLGYTSTSTAAGVLLATRVKDKATLPGGHVINLVAEAQWALLPLAAVPLYLHAAAAEQDFWRALQQHTVPGAHYYCETADLTRPFPSARPPSDPAPEFVWNAWLSAPLRALGLHLHCPALLQGAVESSDEVHPTGQRYTLALLSRRSRRHPGTRYIARGLNELAGPGNEIEAELLTWTPSAGAARAGLGSGSQVRWARVAWRRGTVPIWWGVEVQPLNRGLQAEVYVRQEGPFAGTLTYFRALQRRFAEDAGRDVGLGGASGDVGGSGSGNGMDALVTCVNLLHLSERKAGEHSLSAKFQEGMRGVGRRMGERSVRLLNFDWHGIMQTLTEERGVEAFWSFIEQPLRQAGVAVGCMEPSVAVDDTGATEHTPAAAPAAAAADGGGDGTQCPDSDVTSWGPGWRMRWRHRQRGVLRFNCADSLDRTNAATCFAMLPALQEGLRLLGIPLDLTSSPAVALLQRSPLRSASGSSIAPAAGGSAGDLQQREGRTGSSPTPPTAQQQRQEEDAEEDGSDEEFEEMLPAGWARGSYMGRTVYLDHANKATQWHPPAGTILRPSVSRPRPALSANSPDLRFAPLGAAAAAAGEGREDASPPGPLPAAPSSSALLPPPPPPGLQSAGAPWAFFSGQASLEEVRARLYGDAVADYVEMFKKHGDELSSQYTGSPAMHSHVLGLVLPGGARSYGASAGVGRLQNLRVAVQRRWNNTVSDAARQQSMELFLGMNTARHCPGLKLSHPAPSDLSGPDPDDGPHEGSTSAAELRALSAAAHERRGVVLEGAAPIESLPPEPMQVWSGGEEHGSEGNGRGQVAPAAAPAAAFTVDDSWEEDGTVALDPLGAVRRPLRSLQRCGSDESSAAAAAEQRQGRPAPLVPSLADLLL